MNVTMRAMVLTGHGGVDKLVWHEDWPRPSPSDSQVLVRVLACGLNNTDVNTRTAWYSKTVADPQTGAARATDTNEEGGWGATAITFPRIQGADICGIVEAVGDAVGSDLVGKRVLIDTWLRDWDDPLNMDKCGYLGSEADGGYAEYVCIDWRHVHPIESSYSDVELATFATSYSTAENMVRRAEVSADDTVLIPGASGGVGGALIQLAKRRGARVIAMASQDKHEEVRQLGPDRILQRSVPDLAAELSGERVSVVADVVGGSDWQARISVLERGGRYTCAGAIAGAVVEFDLRTFYLRDLTFTGATIVPPGVFAQLVGYIARGEIRPQVAAVYPLAELHDAQAAFMAKRHAGNIVVTP